MTRHDLHDPRDFFEYQRVHGDAPRARHDRIDIAVLDMNHSWPNIGHDSVIHAILDAAETLREPLLSAGAKIRVLSYDVRRAGALPAAPDGNGALYVATGGPGHIDPRFNDGVSPWSQGIREEGGWETPLFRLFDAIAVHPSAALIGICHSFGLLCRWSGAARPVLRSAKSSGLQRNVLSDAVGDHPWFSRFAAELPDGRHYRVIDNRLFDLVVEENHFNCLAFEDERRGVVTMIEFARNAKETMPRVFGMNHHPEVGDRQHALEVLSEKRRSGEVSDEWVRERTDTIRELFDGDNERSSRLTSEYTFLGPLRHYIETLVTARV